MAIDNFGLPDEANVFEEIAKSEQHMEDQLRRKHRVSPPKYGDIMPLRGTNVHYADSARTTHESLYRPTAE